MADMYSVLVSKPHAFLGSLETTMNCQCKSQHDSMAMIEILWYNTISHGQSREYYLSYATSLWQIYLRLLRICNQFFGVINIHCKAIHDVQLAQACDMWQSCNVWMKPYSLMYQILLIFFLDILSTLWEVETMSS